MKVKELISLLENYDPDMSVVVSGYEDGYENFSIREQKLKHKSDSPYYSGQFQESGSDDAESMLCFMREVRF